MLEIDMLVRVQSPLLFFNPFFPDPSNIVYITLHPSVLGEPVLSRISQIRKVSSTASGQTTNYLSFLFRTDLVILVSVWQLLEVYSVLA